jgi:hypothetical protein
MPKPLVANLVWFAAWLAMMAVVWWLLSVARQRVIADLSRPEAQADWQQWKEDETARHNDPNAPVRRRPPKSDEPPALVLMRDNFAAILGVCLVVATICFGFAMLVLRGVFGDTSGGVDQARKQAT